MYVCVHVVKPWPHHKTDHLKDSHQAGKYTKYTLLTQAPTISSNLYHTGKTAAIVDSPHMGRKPLCAYIVWSLDGDGQIAIKSNDSLENWLNPYYDLISLQIDWPQIGLSTNLSGYQ